MKQVFRKNIALVLLLHLTCSSVGAVQTGIFCPIIPQSNLRENVSTQASEGVLDFTSKNIKKASLAYRVVHARANDIVFIDGGTLADATATGVIRKSKAVVMLRTGEMPEVAMALLGKQVSDIEIVAAVPNNKAGVAKAYRPQTAEITAVVREYESIANQLSAIPNSSVLTQSSSGGATIRETLLKRAGANQKKQLLVVVGHNVDGILRFPDGSSLKVADLADTASKSGRPVLVLSCETMYANIATAGFVTARPLHFDEISRALIKLSTAHRLGQINNVREVIQQINFSLGAPPRASKAEKRTETLVAVAQIGSALLAATIVSTAIGIQQSCKEDRKDKC